MPVGGLDLAAILDFTEQPGVLDGQNRLRGKGLKEIHKLQAGSSPSYGERWLARPSLFFPQQRDREGER